MGHLNEAPIKIQSLSFLLGLVGERQHERWVFPFHRWTLISKLLLQWYSFPPLLSKTGRLEGPRVEEMSFSPSHDKALLNVFPWSLILWRGECTGHISQWLLFSPLQSQERIFLGSLLWEFEDKAQEHGTSRWLWPRGILSVRLIPSNLAKLPVSFLHFIGPAVSALPCFCLYLSLVKEQSFVQLFPAVSSV